MALGDLGYGALRLGRDVPVSVGGVQVGIATLRFPRPSARPKAQLGPALVRTVLLDAAVSHPVAGSGCSSHGGSPRLVAALTCSAQAFKIRLRRRRWGGRAVTRALGSLADEVRRLRRSVEDLEALSAAEPQGCP
jgi:hypothetical protein